MNKILEKIKVFVKGIKMPKITMPKIKLPKLPKIPTIKIKKPEFTKIKAILAKILPLAQKIYNIFIKMVKGLLVWFWKAIKESIAQLWTLLGFFIAWLTLTGTAQQVVGMATILATIIWLVTIPLREEKEE